MSKSVNIIRCLNVIQFLKKGATQVLKKHRMSYGKHHSNQKNSKLASGALTNQQSEEKNLI